MTCTNSYYSGKDNFAVDRAVAERVIQTFPDILVSVRAQRAFLGRAVHYLAAEAGITQFLDIGTGLPSSNNTHEVAQRAEPRTRVVYVDNDPMSRVAYSVALVTCGHAREADAVTCIPYRSGYQLAGPQTTAGPPAAEQRASLPPSRYA